MSDELRLPDHLAACEARLAAQVLPASGINRDELMYRAGWAAGAETARLATVNPPPLKGTTEHRPPEVVGAQGVSLPRSGARGGITAAWSLASAAVAASIAVMTTLQLQPDQPPAVVATPSKVAEPRRSDLPRVDFAHGFPKPLSNGRLNAGLIGLRQRAISNAWTDTKNFTATTGDAAAPTPQTAREMMEELLPSESVRRTNDWPLKLNSPGDSI